MRALVGIILLKIFNALLIDLELDKTLCELAWHETMDDGFNLISDEIDCYRTEFSYIWFTDIFDYDHSMSHDFFKKYRMRYTGLVDVIEER